MSDVITQLFEMDVSSAMAKSISTKKPLFVYTTTANDSLVEMFLSPLGTPDSSVINLLSRRFVCLMVAQNLDGYRRFQHIYPSVTAPSFMVVDGGNVKGVATASLTPSEFEMLIATPATNSSREPQISENRPTSVEKHMSEFARHQHEEREERQRLRALIDADRRERRSAANQHNKFAASTPAPPHVSVSADKYVLSVRLLDGSNMRGEFDGNSTLMDVKRWIESEQDINLTSTESGSLGMMTKPGFPEPSRIAFYAPGTNVTFTVPQELCRLKDLDLCSRLALILKPEYDDLSTVPAPTEPALLSQTGAKVSTMLLALYSFFDYGVDDAQRDLQALSASDDDDEDAEEEISHFSLLAKDSTRAVELAVDSEKRDAVKKDVKEVEVDYTVVGLTRHGTPAPSGSSSIYMSGDSCASDD